MGGTPCDPCVLCVDRRERKYEQHDDSYAHDANAATRRDQFSGWPLVFFRPEMIAHLAFHMAPIISKTRRQVMWYLLDAEDHDTAVADARAEAAEPWGALRVRR